MTLNKVLNQIKIKKQNHFLHANFISKDTLKWLLVQFYSFIWKFNIFIMLNFSLKISEGFPLQISPLFLAWELPSKTLFFVIIPLKYSGKVFLSISFINFMPRKFELSCWLERITYHIFSLRIIHLVHTQMCAYQG